MNSLDISNFIDDRNRHLWNTASSQYNILLAESTDGTYSCFTIKKDAVIYIPSKNICKDSFTHELLHIYLKTKEVFIACHLEFRFLGEENLSQIYSPELLEHIGNCLEHNKMLPIYLKLGFAREKFISDYYTKKCIEEDRKVFNLGLKLDSTIWKGISNVYLGRFFAIKACPNNSFDYTECLAALQDADQRLYQILIEFWNSWVEFDIENMDAVYNDYYSFCSTFINDLEQWAVQRN